MGVRYQRAVDLVELTGILQTTVTGLSIDEIAERFEVSRRTAERMLSALRDRFPDLEPFFRGGRKYWKLPRTSRARPLQLPRTLEALSERIMQLEAAVSESRHDAETAQGITDGVLGTSSVGMIVVDSSSRVVWANRSLGRFFGQDEHDLIGRDMQSLIRDRIQHMFEDPERFARNVLANYRDNSYIENFECHVLPGEGRDERWLEHWSRPIPSGRYAGGRIDHYIDITRRVWEDENEVGVVRPALGRAVAAAELQLPEDGRSRDGRPTDVRPVLRAYLATLKEAAVAAIDASEASPKLLLRLAQVVHSVSQTVGLALDALERGESKLEPLGVAEVLETVVALVQGAAEERGIHLAVAVEQETPAIQGDRAIMVSSLAGATRNSIQALVPGSRVELRADVLQDPDRVRISVLDDGPGVPEAFGQLDRSFVPTRKGGIGLGIAMVRDDEGNPTGIAQYFDSLTWKEGRSLPQA